MFSGRIISNISQCQKSIESFAQITAMKLRNIKRAEIINNKYIYTLTITKGD